MEKCLQEIKNKININIFYNMPCRHYFILSSSLCFTIAEYDSNEGIFDLNDLNDLNNK